MHRIDGPGFAPGNLFTQGNPATGTPATTVTPDWMNDVQENIVAAILAAGIPLTKGRTDDLLDAIRVLPRILDRQTATIDVVNTTVETDLYRFTVPGGTLGTDRVLRLTLHGNLRNNVSASESVNVQGYYGATKLGTWTWSPSGPNTLRRHWWIVAHLYAKGFPSSQTAEMHGEFGIPVQDPNPFGGSTFPASVGHGTVAEDSTLAKDLAITATWLGVADFSKSIQRLNARLELLR